MWANFWNLRINDRLTQWKDFRRYISDLSLDKAILEVNNLWSTAPFINYHLAPDDPKTWPDPWVLLAENYWCNVAKALGIVYTIYFTSHKIIPIEIKVFYDYTDKIRYALVWLDNGKYILNYYPYEIVNTESIEKKQLYLLYQYKITDLQLEKY